MRSGGDVCILAVGKMVEAAEDAAGLLDARGVHAAVWDVRTIPLDRRMLADARSYDLVITAEDGIAEGGVGAAIVAELGRMESGQPPPSTITLGTPLAFLPHGAPVDLLANLGLDGPGIAASALKALEADG